MAVGQDEEVGAFSQPGEGLTALVPQGYPVPHVPGGSQDGFVPRSNAKQSWGWHPVGRGWRPQGAFPLGIGVKPCRKWEFHRYGFAPKLVPVLVLCSQAGFAGGCRKGTVPGWFCTCGRAGFWLLLSPPGFPRSFGESKDSLWCRHLPTIPSATNAVLPVPMSRDKCPAPLWPEEHPSCYPCSLQSPSKPHPGLPGCSQLHPKAGRC